MPRAACASRRARLIIAHHPSRRTHALAAQINFCLPLLLHALDMCQSDALGTLQQQAAWHIALRASATVAAFIGEGRPRGKGGKGGRQGAGGESSEAELRQRLLSTQQALEETKLEAEAEAKVEVKAPCPPGETRGRG